MLMAWLLHNWHGYVWVRLSGYSPERFLNLCGVNGIEIWNVRYQNGTYEFFMTAKGFRASKPLMQKANVRLRISKKLGLPFFLHKNRKRKLLFGGFASFFLLLYLMSLFIWDISFEGNRQYTDDQLVRYFETQNIRYGMMKNKISCDQLEAALRNEFSEITWVSARVSGTRLLVKIKENEVLSSIPEKDEEPCDIVAAAPAVITRMIVRTGVPQVSIGDQVEAGQLLVSGAVPITNDGEEVVRTEYVHADADIYGETSHSYQESFQTLHQVRVKTGKKRHGIYLRAWKYDLTLLLPGKKDSLWTFVTEERQWKIFEDFYLPFYQGTITGEEYGVYQRQYREDEKKQIAEEIHRRYLEKLMEKGVHIIENNVKILGNESVCQVEGTVTAEEPIGQTRYMTETEGESISR